MASKFSDVDSLLKTLKFGAYEYRRHWTLQRFPDTFKPFLFAAFVTLLAVLIHLVRVQRLVDRRTAELRREMVERKKELEAQNREVVARFHRLERISTMSMISIMVAHELRQPLSALRYGLFTIGAVLERQGWKDAVVEKALFQSRRQTDRIKDIVEHVYACSRSARRDSLVSLESLVDEVLSEARSMHLAVDDIDLQLEPRFFVRGNLFELKLAVFNLLKNAVQASSDSAPAICIRSKHTDTGIELEVSDQGGAHHHTRST